MKMKIGILLTTFLVSLLVACTSVNNEPDKETKDNKVKASFSGKIAEINGQNAIVEINEGEILKSGNRVFVNLSVNKNTTFQVGDKISVEYDGEIRESNPLRINVTNVELIN
ncbi:DUF3221 domain-containing protein [Peribacillus asahii]|uniref:DUF3221 domain-containing protein n=1 Tax=Peribacillus asahii TaxID=228899 RepID=UPI003804526C